MQMALMITNKAQDIILTQPISRHCGRERALPASVEEAENNKFH